LYTDTINKFFFVVVVIGVVGGDEIVRKTKISMRRETDLHFLK
jgi:hypothetical protein